MNSGFVVIDGALPPSICAHIRQELQIFFERVPMQAPTDTHKHNIRSDQMTGSNEEEMKEFNYVGVAKAINLLKGVAHELATVHEPTLRVAPNAQIARFPGEGTHYKRHADNLFNDDGSWNNWRIFTVILYCNDAWQPSHGGCLRMYDGHEQTDIEPLAGRIVIFMSALQHEVLPTWHERFAITLWTWRVDDDGRKFSRS